MCTNGHNAPCSYIVQDLARESGRINMVNELSLLRPKAFLLRINKREASGTMVERGGERGISGKDFFSTPFQFEKV
jgi:hypothetical protein